MNTRGLAERQQIDARILLELFERYRPTAAPTLATSRMPPHGE
ncbi:MAG: hypothetical protein ABIZ96_11195 [Gemmatimonadales bacterium]